jgi:hypothetical protein
LGCPLRRHNGRGRELDKQSQFLTSESLVSQQLTAQRPKKN